MQITGDMLIGASAVRGTASRLQAFDPAQNAAIGPVFGGGGEAEVAQACALAAEAEDSFRDNPPQVRARLLEAIAGGIEALGDALIERAMSETGLPRARLVGERARTIGQLQLFATVVRDGGYARATFDTPLPARQPARRPDLRQRRIGIGPVAVFGASNFPLAFSVAGGDTAAALAAGCPVVVKAHPAHLGTSELVGRVIQQAVADVGLPEGVFSLLIGEGNAIGEALVRHPAIQAVGFTGSRRGGLALMAIASARTQPIPVYAEMSSINPMFLLPGALRARTQALADGFADSLTLGAGQFCTNPGLVLGIEGTDFARWRELAAAAVARKDAATMLTAGIHASYEAGVAALASLPGVQSLGRGAAGIGPNAAQAALFMVDAASLLAEPALQHENFGPSALLVSCRDEAEMLAVAQALEGQLTATLHLEADDHAQARRLLPVLERKAGRILANGFPTGVEVSHAMVHGGSFPATSDGRSTSVGTAAIERFLRPVCYQDLPDALLPAVLQDANPLAVPRSVDGGDPVRT